MSEVLSNQEMKAIDAYWRAANYLSVGQIYLYDNPLLEEPLTLEHIKPRLLGHWGTTPGLNFVYVHLNRVIRSQDLDMIYVTGPGHGGPGLVANAYLEGTYREIYPNISQDADGLKRLFKQFSFPGGIPSHVAPETPGSIHEGGELGYSLGHRSTRVTTHYSAAELSRLIEAAECVCERDGRRPELVVLRGAFSRSSRKTPASAGEVLVERLPST